MDFPETQPEVLATGQTLAIGAKLIMLINQYPFRQPIASTRFQPMAKKSPPTPEVNSPATEPSDTLLSQLIGYALRRAQLKVAQNLVEQLNPFDLRPAQFSALLIIEASPGLMQTDLASILAIEPPQVVTLLNKLEKLGLAVRVRCKPDKRSYGIFLSKAGETLLKQLKEIAAASDRESTAALSDAERQQLLQLLHKVYRQDSNATD
jgi:DNA-binding MarR family transcriptional regulator